MKHPLFFASQVVLAVLALVGAQASGCNGDLESPSDGGPDAADAGADVTDDGIANLPPLDGSTNCTVGGNSNSTADYVDFCLQKQILVAEHKVFNPDAGHRVFVERDDRRTRHGRRRHRLRSERQRRVRRVARALLDQRRRIRRHGDRRDHRRTGPDRALRARPGGAHDAPGVVRRRALYASAPLCAGARRPPGNGGRSGERRAYQRARRRVREGDLHELLPLARRGPGHRCGDGRGGGQRGR